MRYRPWSGAGAIIVIALAAILTTTVPAHAKFGDQTLAKGDTGRDVRVLQRWLGYLGYETTVDGHFGRGTARALRGYERRYGHRVDGRLSRGQARGLRKRAVVAYAERGGRSAAKPRAVSEGPGETATLGDDGRAVAPASAPQPVKDAIAAANEIVDKPYKYGGGHGSFEDSGYDCSGAVSYALRGAGVLKQPLDSSGLMSWGEAGEGQWITVYAHSGHAYVVIAGLRFDTSGRGEEGPRWRPERRSSSGYTVRHPRGL